eukprot:CAMPEP_0168522658 /NCGR_PEP_ID=MMETSP0405-20121227/9475_1 /TAXON_ID=498012 /ORGANISM="Trichosphaerium sp, Strain Am-I-7 wt" /LENGTH=481 /DNA_ID=CAMNT_0008544295 /DNA_START=168 /DNA_END=1613 /DNA_ORIENTATION=+
MSEPGPQFRSPLKRANSAESDHPMLLKDGQGIGVYPTDRDMPIYSSEHPPGLRRPYEGSQSDGENHATQNIRKRLSRTGSKGTKLQWIPVVDHKKQPIVMITSKLFVMEAGKKLNFFDMYADENLELLDSDSFADYQKFFTGKEHVTWTGIDAMLGPCVLSIMTITDQTNRFRVLLRTPDGDKRLFIRANAIGDAKAKNTITKAKKLLHHLMRVCKTDKRLESLAAVKFKRVKNPQFVQELVTYERKLVQTDFKVGVIYIKSKQKREEEMFANTKGSKAFTEFMEFMANGKKIPLKNWPKYSGGLDVTKNNDGEYSYHTELNGEAEIMFHVSTLIPNESYYNGKSKKPSIADVITKKIHIGNDIVVIIFNDGKAAFNPDSMTSQFNHVFIAVTRIPATSDRRTLYRVTVAYKQGVDAVKPKIPAGQTFEKTPEFRKLLLAKIINSERSAYRAMGFRDSRQRMRHSFLLHLHENSKKHASGR